MMNSLRMSIRQILLGLLLMIALGVVTAGAVPPEMNGTGQEVRAQVYAVTDGEQQVKRQERECNKHALHITAHLYQRNSAEVVPPEMSDTGPDFRAQVYAVTDAERQVKRQERECNKHALHITAHLYQRNSAAAWQRIKR